MEETMNKPTLKDRLNELSEKAKLKAIRVVEWGKSHKETIVVFGPVIGGAIIEFIKISTRAHTVREERVLKERFIYDDRHRHYYELKRQPRKSEWLQIDQRKDNGESLGLILEEMGLLKY